MKRSANCFGVMPQAAASAATALWISHDPLICFGAIALRQFVWTIYHKVEGHEKRSF